MTSTHNNAKMQWPYSGENMLKTVWYDPLCLYIIAVEEVEPGAFSILLTYPSSPAGFLHIDPPRPPHTHMHTRYTDSCYALGSDMVCINPHVCLCFSLSVYSVFHVSSKIFPSIHSSFSSHLHPNISNAHFSCPSIISACFHHSVPPRTPNRHGKNYRIL